MAKRKLVDLEVTYVHHTEKAVCVDNDVWVPLSMCETEPSDLSAVKRNGQITLTLYEDLAQEKGLT